MNQEKYEDTKLYVKINREEIEQYLKNSHSGINAIIDGNTNGIHFYLMSDKDLSAHDKELVAKVLKAVSIELENETETYCEIRQCTSPHYQGDYVWFNYVKFRKFAEKLQKEFEDEQKKI